MSSASSAGPPRKKTKTISEEGLRDLEKLLFEDDADQTMTNADQTAKTMTNADQTAKTMTYEVGPSPVIIAARRGQSRRTSPPPPIALQDHDLRLGPPPPAMTYAKPMTYAKTMTSAKTTDQTSAKTMNAMTADVGVESDVDVDVTATQLESLDSQMLYQMLD